MQTDVSVIDLMKMRWSRDAAVTVEQFLTELGGLAKITVGSSAVRQYRFVDLDSSGDLVTAPDATGKVYGVSDEIGKPGSEVQVRIGGRAQVYISGDISDGDELVATTGGYAAPMLETDKSLMSAVAGADASDDIDQTNLPDTVQATSSADESGNTLIIRGKVGTVYTEEILPLVDTGVATSTNTWAAVYSLETTAESVGTIDIEDGTGTGLLIPQITATTAARHYGAILTDDADDATGLEIAVNAGGANTAEVVAIGTDRLGVAKQEIFTMDGTTPVDSADTYRTVTTLLIGADGIAFNAGVTSQYDITVPNTLDRSIRGTALEDQTTVDGVVEFLIRTQGIGEDTGAARLVGVGRFTSAGGDVNEDVTIAGVQASDCVTATLNVKGASPQTIVTAEYQAANTVRVVFSADPSTDHEFTVVVYRP